MSHREDSLHHEPLDSSYFKRIIVTGGGTADARSDEAHVLDASTSANTTRGVTGLVEERETTANQMTTDRIPVTSPSSPRSGDSLNQLSRDNANRIHTGNPPFLPSARNVGAL